MQLKEKVILVTGSTTGIGEGMVRLFGERGATVIIHGTREKAAKELTAELKQNKIAASYVLGSLDDPTVPQMLIQHVTDTHGRIDGLVNNAAIMTRSNLETTDLLAFDRTIAVNLRAPFLLIQAAYPHFKKQGGGRVINIGSINGYSGEANQMAYAVAKGGLITLTRNLADAYGRYGIRVNIFNVGWTLTQNEYDLKRKEGLPDDWPSLLPKVHAPSGRLFTPREIAAFAAFFLSDEAGLINGTSLDIEQWPLIGRLPLHESL